MGQRLSMPHPLKQRKEVRLSVYDVVRAGSFEARLRAAVSLAWKLFARKVGAGSIHVHKEASMQLQYAYVLQQLLPFGLL
jgi:hypothetical protein